MLRRAIRGYLRVEGVDWGRLESTEGTGEGMSSSFWDDRVLLLLVVIIVIMIMMLPC